MEPAMTLCSGLAAVALTFGVLGSLPAFTRRLATVHIPIPVRSLAVLLMMVSTTAVLVRPKPAAAAVPPPIVRLVEEAPPPTEEVETPTDAVEHATSASTPGRSVRTPRVSTEQEQPNSDAYVVEPGDSLWRIAASVLHSNGGGDPSSADIARFWPTIYAANRILIGDNPSLIFPGQRLLIPEG